MYERYDNSYYALEFADFLNKRLQGENCVIYEPRSVDSVKNNSVIYIDSSRYDNFQYEKLKPFSDLLVITDGNLTGIVECSWISTPSPKVDFVKILNRFFVKRVPLEAHPTAVVSGKAVVGNNVSIGAHVFIGPDVTIGDDTVIHQNAVIGGKVRIGRNCVIKANATIGSEGFGFVFDEKERLEHFPQMGGIVIGDNVWIGANSTVERGALDDTIIENDAKVDDLVQIGHSSVIGESALITAGVIVCGRARIGRKCWIAPNATVNNAVLVGDNALVGLGSVVLKDVPAGTVVAGCPARPLRKR